MTLHPPSPNVVIEIFSDEDFVDLETEKNKQKEIVVDPPKTEPKKVHPFFLAKRTKTAPQETPTKNAVREKKTAKDTPVANAVAPIDSTPKASLTDHIQRTKEIDARFFSNKKINPFFLKPQTSSAVDQSSEEMIQLAGIEPPLSVPIHVNYSARAPVQVKEKRFQNRDSTHELSVPKESYFASRCTLQSSPSDTMRPTPRMLNLREKYAPKKLEDFLPIQQTIIQLLSTWLNNFSPPKVRPAPNPTKPKKKRRYDSDEEEDFVVDTEDEYEPEQEPETDLPTESGPIEFKPIPTFKSVYLFGPTGSAKSVILNYVLEGYHILEINAGMKRSPKDISKMCSEATQSHLVENGIQRRVILFEDAEVIFESDKGYWGSIESLISTTKVPIILVANGNSFD